MRTLLAVPIVWLIASAQIAGGQEQQTAQIGDLKLENGNVIRDCVIGYRAFGYCMDAEVRSPHHAPREGARSHHEAR
jgi:hypothetical protein